MTMDPGRLLTAGVKIALRDLARRWKALDEEIKTLNKQIDVLVRAAAPDLIELHGVGVEIAGQFLAPSATTPSGSTVRPPSPSSAASHHSPPAADAPAAVTGSAAAVIARPTAHSTSSPSSGCDTTSPPATTSNAVPPRD